MRSYVATALEPEYEIIAVATGFQALQALPNGRFDVVISDVHMPDINGLELAKFMSAYYKEVPLILISTEASDRDVDRGLSLGATAYLPKPFSPAALREAVHRALAAPSS
jgi:two-component system, chemotaxis family, chemotaxis protein CheY